MKYLADFTYYTENNMHWDLLPSIRKRFKQLNENTELLTTLTTIKPLLAQAAQLIYNLWEQDSEGIDEIYGAGGICDDIASAMCGVIMKHTGLNCTTHYNSYDTHTSVYAYDTENKICFNIDIPANNYETGYGYNWKKINNVTFTADMVHIIEIPYSDFIDDNDEFIED